MAQLRAAFLPSAPVNGRVHTTSQTASARRPGKRRTQTAQRRRTSACTPAPTPEATPEATPESSEAPTEPESPATRAAPIPSSLSDAASQAIAAAQTAFSTGGSRVFVEVDLSAGDATYTLLKSSLPLVRELLPLFAEGPGRVHVLLPDAGAAALARRDWGALPEHVAVAGLEEAAVDAAADAGVVVVAPRASDVERLCAVVAAAGGLRVAVVNPDLVDMGVTGLSLNARRLRESLIDTFVPAYYLKTFDWGVLLRAFPGTWGVWVDAPGTAVGFRLVGEVESRPSLEEIDAVLAGADAGQGPGLFAGLRRFLSMYMRG